MDSSHVSTSRQTGPSREVLTVTNTEAYKSLSADDLTSYAHPMSTGGKATWLSSFVNKHLPSNRLRANEDDLSAKYQSVDLTRERKKKKRGKSRALIPNKERLAPKRRWMFKPDGGVSFCKYLPLKAMWTKYMEELINFQTLTESSLPNAAQKMMKADLHGCPLMVRRSKCPSYVGVGGIVLQETRNMFVMVTPEDQVRSVPKANSVFCVSLHGYVFTIHGNHFIVKPGDRAAKKFKSKPSIDL